MKLIIELGNTTWDTECIKENLESFLKDIGKEAQRYAKSEYGASIDFEVEGDKE